MSPLLLKVLDCSLQFLADKSVEDDWVQEEIRELTRLGDLVMGPLTEWVETYLWPENCQALASSNFIVGKVSVPYWWLAILPRLFCMHFHLDPLLTFTHRQELTSYNCALDTLNTNHLIIIILFWTPVFNPSRHMRPPLLVRYPNC